MNVKQAGSMQGVPDLETQHIVSRNWDGMVWQGRENKAENTRGTATEEKSNKNLPQALHFTYKKIIPRRNNPTADIVCSTDQ